MPQSKGPEPPGGRKQPFETQLHPPHTLRRPSSFLQRLKLLFLGQPLATQSELAHRLPILLALPVFASDALSSNAYATDEIMIQLANAGPMALRYVIPISVAISGLMVIVAASYRRAILLYPTSGGSYTVARKNLGASYGLIAGSALIIDYILTVAVSVSAGVLAVTSYLPAVYEYRVWVGLALLAFIAWLNLRGARESGWAFAGPAYAFVVTLALTLATVAYRHITGHVTPLPPADPAHAIPVTQALTAFLLMKAFSSGCAALTGVEAISNGVQVFQPPEARNAAKTLLILIITSVGLFMGLAYAAHVFGAQPSDTENLISQIARGAFTVDGLFPAWLGNALRALTLGSVLAVLLVASNTAFAGLPQLLALMARDGFAPRVLLGLGDKLVYSRSIMGLAVIGGVLVLIFKASVNSLIPLYAVGVFLCFTLSQIGMFKRIVKDKQPGWFGAALVNAIGGGVTGIVMVVIAATKFMHGAWVVVLLIPLLVMLGYAIKRHYQWFENRMAIRPGDYNPLSGPVDHLTVVVLLSSDIHRGTLEGLEAARAIVEGRKSSMLRALHIEIDPEKTKRLTTKWEKMVKPYLGHMIQLDIVPSPYRKLIPPVVEYLNRLDAERKNDRIVVLIPEFETGSFWTHLLHNQTAPRLRQALYHRPNVTVIANRFFMLDPDEIARRRKSRRPTAH